MSLISEISSDPTATAIGCLQSEEIESENLSHSVRPRSACSPLDKPECYHYTRPHRQLENKLKEE